MSHPSDLIARIQDLIEVDYPPDAFHYLTEKALPGTRLMPDVLVLDQARKPVCVVEIGYTRPEKLTAYRKIHNIPDVRWYGKDGTLHGDIEERFIRITVSVAPVGLFSIYEMEDEIDCSRCIGEVVYRESAAEDVRTLIVSNDMRALFPCFCDKCGEVWVESDRRKLSPLLNGLRNWGKLIGHRSWERVAEFAEGRYGGTLDPSYDDCLFLDQSAENAHYNAIRKALATERAKV